MTPQFPRAIGTSVLVLVCAVAVGGEPAPKGPPWVRDLAAAQKTALERGTPIFIYFTKTYCPHCVPIEKDVLPSSGLKPAYDKAVWVYNNRSFDRSAADLAAERIELRFGMSSYPQLVTVDPVTLTVIDHLGRTEQALLDGFEKAAPKVTKAADAKKTAEKFRDAEARAVKLAKSASVPDAKKALTDDDIVVRYTALQILTAKSPKAVAEKAGDLLAEPNDLFRFRVCDVLTKAGDKAAAETLEKLLDAPKGSNNPNMLRVNVVEALAACGTEASIPVVAKYATTGDYNNGLTQAAIDALAALAARHPKAKAEVKQALLDAFPPALTSGQTPAEKTRCVDLAKRVHQHLTKLTRKAVAFPAAYDDAAREKLKKGW
ncbi:MAG: HEAT repeat domain-containing protein [Gemmataceae bacterium]